jgi:hypothetical protein
MVWQLAIATACSMCSSHPDTLKFINQPFSGPTDLPTPVLGPLYTPQQSTNWLLWLLNVAAEAANAARTNVIVWLLAKSPQLLARPTDLAAR